MAGANQQTRHVRHHQANEADRTGKGHRRAHQQRSERDQAATGAGHIQAEVLRLAFAQRQHVEGRGQPLQREHADREQRHHRCHIGPVGACQRTHLPEHQRLQFAFAGNVGQEADQRRAERGHCDADQQQRGIATALARARQRVGQADRQRAANECGDRHQPTRRTGSAEHDGGHRTQRRALADANDARIGQGIAEQALQAGPGHRQRRADHRPQQRTRDAQLPDHGQVTTADRLRIKQTQLHAQRLQHFQWRQPQRTHGKRRQHRPQQCQQRHHQHHPPATAAPIRRTHAFGNAARALASASAPAPEPTLVYFSCTSGITQTRLACPAGVCFSVG
ncbi:hypothetical protein G6F31_013720 [Rhizopus arrhizus]|nr:hypothetical protein G6F31_013720 [Rhizopus arrhizus]